MPELPEVQTVVDTLAPMLVGRRIERVTHLRADIVTPAGVDLKQLLAGRAVQALWRRGKRIVFELDDGHRLFVHLGMTGQLTIEPADRPRKLHCHFAADVQGKELRFVDPRRFGGITWCGDGDPVDQLGPEPLTMRAAQLLQRLSATRRVIKTALLDQSVIAGIGNIYADEALFAARVHPLVPSNKITADESRRLSAAIKRVLRRAIRHRGSSLRDYVDANGERGAFQLRHNVYDREGEACRNCGSKIVRIVVGQRSTHFCRRCQQRTK